VIEAISPAKDVDGFHVASAGALMTGMPGFWPCTPYGCMKMLESTGIRPARQARGGHRPQQHRGQAHGADAAAGQRHRHHLPQRAHADLKAQTLQADVIVAAVGKRNVLTADMVKPGAVVIDVGMNRNDEGKLCGDVDFAGVREVAGWITPVPGGRRAHDHHHAAGQHLEAAERAAGHDMSRLIALPPTYAAQLEPARPRPPSHRMSNALLDFSDLPRLTDPPEHVARHGRAAGEGQRSALKPSRRRFPGRLDAIAKVLDVPPSAWAAPGGP
jgi:hypothetical protein